jgi:hypothetical protein
MCPPIPAVRDRDHPLLSLDLLDAPWRERDEVVHLGQVAGLARDPAVDELDQNHFVIFLCSTSLFHCEFLLASLFVQQSSINVNLTAVSTATETDSSYKP